MSADEILMDDEPGTPPPMAPLGTDNERTAAAATLPLASNRERTPPHDVDAEAAALGACFFGEPEVVDKVLLALTAPEFYRPAHQAVFTAVQELRGAGAVVDLVTVQGHLQAAGLLERAGGPLALVDLMGKTSSTSNVEAYVGMVKDAARLRQLLGAVQQIQGAIYGRAGSVADIIDGAGEAVAAVAEGRAVDFERIGEGWQGHFDDLVASSTGRKRLGLPTPWDGWNRILGGIIPGKVYVIGAIPGEGKSTLALNIADHLANQNHPCAFFSLEMDKAQIRDRLVASKAEIEGGKIERGAMNEEEMDLYAGAMKAIARNPLHLYHDPYMNLQRLLALARVAVSKLRCRVLFVDYLQMLHDDSQRFGSYAQELSNICMRLAAFARAHQVAIVEVAQLNRDLKGDEPKVWHLKDSGGIEAAADVVALLHDKKDKDYAGQAVVPVQLIFGKNRGGDRGRLELQHHRPFLRFTHYA